MTAATTPHVVRPMVDSARANQGLEEGRAHIAYPDITALLLQDVNVRVFSKGVVNISSWVGLGVPEGFHRV